MISPHQLGPCHPTKGTQHKGQTMKYNKALDKLIKTRVLTTGLLKPLHIPFENFLRYAQMNDDRQEQLIDSLILHLEKFRGIK